MGLVAPFGRSKGSLGNPLSILDLLSGDALLITVVLALPLYCCTSRRYRPFALNELNRSQLINNRGVKNV